MFTVAANSGLETQPAPLRVLIVDDHEAFRTILRKALSRQPLIAVEIVAEARNGHEGVEATARHLPEVVIMDVEMPCQDGIEATRQIVQRFPAIRVIGWTMCDERMTEAMRAAGATVVLSKNAGLASLFEALLTVAAAMGTRHAPHDSESA